MAINVSVETVMKGKIATKRKTIAKRTNARMVIVNLDLKDMIAIVFRVIKALCVMRRRIIARLIIASKELVRKQTIAMSVTVMQDTAGDSVRYQPVIVWRNHVFMGTAFQQTVGINVNAIRDTKVFIVTRPTIIVTKVLA